MKGREHKPAAEAGQRRPPPEAARAGTEEAVLELQRTAGNRAVDSLLDGTGGRPLPRAARAGLEAELGAPLEGVRIHDDERSSAVTEALGARAAARGEHVHFDRGEYRPQTAGGRRLLVHELAHVIQQRGGTEATGSRAAAEAEAEAAAGGTAAPMPGTAPVGAVQLAAQPRGRARYPELDWSDFEKAYAKLTPVQRRQLDFEEGTPLQAQAATAEEAATLAPREGALERAQRVVGTAHEVAGEAVSGVTGLTAVESLRNLEPSQQGERLAQGLNDRTMTFREIADAIDNADAPERVAYALMRSPVMQSSLQLDKMSSTKEGRYLLERLFVRVTEGATGPIEGFVRGLVPLPLADDTSKKLAQAARVMQARIEAVPLDRWAKAKPDKMKVFPFQTQGLTTLAHTPWDVQVTPDGKLWVQASTKLAGNYLEEYKSLPADIMTRYVEIDPEEIIAVRRYDRGGQMEYMPAIYLLQLDQEYLTNTVGKIQTVAGLGAAVGGGLPSAGGKTGVAAGLARADQAVLAISALTLAVNENRAWLEEQGYGGFLDTLDVVNTAASIYGLAQLVKSAPEMIRGVHESYEKLRERRRIEAETLAPEQQAALQQIERQLDALPKPPTQSVVKPQEVAKAVEKPQVKQLPERQEVAKPKEGPVPTPKRKAKSEKRKAAAAREGELRELEREELTYEGAASSTESREREQRRGREEERSAARERPPTPEEVEAQARTAVDEMMARAQRGELSAIKFTEKQAVLDRFKKTLERTNLTPVEQNRKAGAFNEALTKSGAALETQPSYVAGAPVQEGMRIRPPGKKRPRSLAKEVRPDEIIQIEGSGRQKVKAVLERKSDELRDLSTRDARARARRYTKDAVDKAVNLPTSMPQTIRYTNQPASADARQAMLEEHFMPESPFVEVHFGTEAVKRAAWEAERGAQPQESPTIDKPPAGEKPSSAIKPPVVEKAPSEVRKPSEAMTPPAPKKEPLIEKTAGPPKRRVKAAAIQKTIGKRKGEKKGKQAAAEPWSLEAEVERQRKLAEQGLAGPPIEGFTETVGDRAERERLRRLREMQSKARSGN